MHIIVALVSCSLAVHTSAAGDSKPVGVVYKEGSKTSVKSGNDKASGVLKQLEGKSTAEVKKLLNKLKTAVNDKKKAKPPAPAPKKQGPTVGPKAQKSETDLDKKMEKELNFKKYEKSAPLPKKKAGLVEGGEKRAQPPAPAPGSVDDLPPTEDDGDMPITADEDESDEEIADNFDDELAMIADKSSKSGPKRTIPIGADFSPDFAEDFESADSMSSMSAEQQYMAEEEAALALQQQSQPTSMQFYFFIFCIAGVAGGLYYYRDSPTPAWAKHLAHGELMSVSIPGLSPEVDYKAKQSLLSGSTSKFKEASALDDFGLSNDTGGYGGLSTEYGGYGGLSTGPTSLKSAPPPSLYSSNQEIEEFGL